MKYNKILQEDNMVQAVISLGEYEDRILTIVKGKFGFKNKSEAVNFVIDKFEEEFLEPELRPEYVKRLKKIKKEKGIPFKSIEELRKEIENA
ncbi:MAG: DUF2683 family protein [Nanoarchaeota archaeon]|nr:DUF2683 family protein [Nanoarchaeota archaeon]